VQKERTSFEMVFSMWPKITRKRYFSTGSKKGLHYAHRKGSGRNSLNRPWIVKSYTSWKIEWCSSIKYIMLHAASKLDILGVKTRVSSHWKHCSDFTVQS
jgi:hypothetical protein